MVLRVLLLPALGVSACSALDGAPEPEPPLGALCPDEGGAVLRTARAEAHILVDPFSLSVRLPDGTVLLETAGPPSATSVAPRMDRTEVGDEAPWVAFSEVTGISCGTNEVQISLAAAGGAAQAGRLVVATDDDPRSFSVSFVPETPPLPPAEPRVRLTFRQADGDTFYGMGERFDEAEHSGNQLVVWAEEGCLSQCEEETESFFPVPYALLPPHLGVLLDDTHFSRWDFGKTDPARTRIDVDHQQLDLRLFVGADPREVTEAYTAFAGRIPSLPTPWVFAPWVSAVWDKKGDAPNSEVRTRELAARLRAARVPTSGIWNEDWAGGQGTFLYVDDLAVDLQHYPDWGRLIADMHADGFRVFAYFYPYLPMDGEQVQAARDANALATTPEGDIASFWLLTPRATLDVTSPEAVDWWYRNVYEEAARYGVDGWMNDFGEYVGPNFRFADGRDGLAMHNAYPVEWARVAREYWDARRPDGDYVFFSRSGYTGSWQYSPVVWTGDQNTDWTQGDGLPSVIAAVTALGISGAPIVTTDIGGFFCLTNGTPADRELYYRWTQLGAAFPVMREHNGMFNCPKNFLLDTDAASLEHWKTYAVFHTSLFPLFYTLVAEARDTGMPVARHLVLEFPEDPGPRARQDDQFLIGDRVLVAPVIEQGATERSVWFPEGRWIHWQTGETFEGPAERTVAAPLESAPYFYREGRIIPRYDTPIDTLVTEDDPDLAGFQDANASLEILFHGSGTDVLTLWDGTVLSCDGVKQVCEATGAPVERTYTSTFR